MQDSTEAIAAGVSLESVLCTEKLEERPSRPSDYRAEIQALLALVHQLKSAPHDVLQTLVDTALELCRANEVRLEQVDQGVLVAARSD